ncbi:MAG: hypothetical protein R3C19_26835 [Planctomycetaceae bacterium]
MTQLTTEYSEAAIFSRLIEAQAEPLSPELAGHILSLQLSPQDERRLDELLPKAQDGTLTAEEKDELESLNHIADLLSLWQSRARRVLQTTRH